MDVQKTVAQRLKSIRKSRKLSQQAVAEKLECTQAHVAYVESGKRDPSLEILTRYAAYFRVSMDYIFGFCEEESGPKSESEFLESTNIASKELFRHPGYVVSGADLEKYVRAEVLRQLNKNKK